MQIAFLSATAAICVVLWNGPLRSQTPEGAIDRAASISGRVLDSSGDPIGKVVLSLRSSPPELALGGPPVQSAKDGSFSFSGLPPGRYRIEADHPAYAAQSFPTLFSLAGGQKVTGVDIVLEPRAVLSGRLSDIDGEPLQGIPVVAYRLSYPEGRRRLSVVQSNVTDDRGVFRLADLQAGRYYLAANRYPPGVYRQH